MSQRKNIKGQQSRTRLMMAARSEFAEKGYHDAKVSSIVENAGLTQAAFYLYFPSKDAIFGELVEQFHDSLRQSIQTGRLPEGLQRAEVQQHMQAHLSAVYALMAADPDLTRIALFESTQAETIKRELAQMLVVNFEMERDMGYLRSDFALEVAAEYVVGIVERASQRWLLTKEKTVAELATETANFIMLGLFK